MTVYIRILLGWLGAMLIGAGVSENLITTAINDPNVISFVESISVEIVGAIFLAAQVVWWKVAKRFGWST